MKTKEEVKEKKGKRLRSPGYPMISLKEAIQKANTLWDKDRRNLIPKEAAFAHLGFKKIGGYGGRIIAALKHYGLTSEKENGIILTQDAVDLAIYKSTDEDYINIVKKIALKPDIYNKIYNGYNGQLPSDDTLRVKLLKEYRFHPDKVKGFISDFRKTIEFAGLSKGIEIKGKDDVKTRDDINVILSGKEQGKTQIMENTTPIVSKTYPIPLSKGKNAAIIFETLPVEKKDIEAIRKWLEFYSDNLTETEE